VTESPENADERGAANAAFAADDSGDGNDVIGVGGVTHAEKKSESDDGEERNHKIQPDLRIICIVNQKGGSSG